MLLYHHSGSHINGSSHKNIVQTVPVYIANSHRRAFSGIYMRQQHLVPEIIKGIFSVPVVKAFYLRFLKPESKIFLLLFLLRFHGIFVFYRNSLIGRNI